MTTIKLSDAKARKIYPGASSEIKEILEESFGKEFFSQKITDRIKTYDDACEAIGKRPGFDLLDDDTPDEIAYKQLKTIIKALNEGWIPDWNNGNETKYYPWFEFKKDRGFVFSGFGYDCTCSVVGSRLCFKSRELAEYAAKQFQPIYNNFLKP